ncbi:unnamed protein product, partial [Amoebophrya sp. A25]
RGTSGAGVHRDMESSLLETYHMRLIAASFSPQVCSALMNTINSLAEVCDYFWTSAVMLDRHVSGGSRGAGVLSPGGGAFLLLPGVAAASIGGADKNKKAAWAQFLHQVVMAAQVQLLQASLLSRSIAGAALYRHITETTVQRLTHFCATVSLTHSGGLWLRMSDLTRLSILVSALCGTDEAPLPRELDKQLAAAFSPQGLGMTGMRMAGRVGGPSANSPGGAAVEPGTFAPGAAVADESCDA